MYNFFLFKLHSHGQRSSEIDKYKVHEFFQSLFSVFVRGSLDGEDLETSHV